MDLGRSAPVVLSLCSRCLRECRKSIHAKASALQKLIEIGRFETPKTSGHYQSGQFFLHRVFGYRGVILFPWVAKIYDRDVTYGRESKRTTWEENGLVYDHVKGMTAETRPYYQALIDYKDFPFIRTQPEAVTYLADQGDMSFYAIPGLDYVSHEDVLPYTSTGLETFNHDLFEQFFIPSGSEEGPLPSDMLRVWRDKNHHWLELSDVHRETTKGVRITVMPFFIGSRQMQQYTVYWWRYNIRLENLSGDRLQLRERHWRIYSLSGTLETVKGRGVIGQEPILSSSQPAFQYSSHVSLQSPSGHMWGTFRLERQDKQMFDVRIPPFTLESHNKTIKNM